MVCRLIKTGEVNNSYLSTSRKSELMDLRSTMYFLAEELHDEAKYVFLPEERSDEGKNGIFGRGVQRRGQKNT